MWNTFHELMKQSIYCPRPNRTCSGDYSSLYYGDTPAIVSFISCSLSLLGSLITVLPYLLWKDTRTGIRRIITFLAVADFFTAASYIMGNINFYIYKHNSKTAGINTACNYFDQICEVQSYISSWASYSSFWWTSILALYLYWTVVKGDIKKGERYFPLYHVLSWGSPMLAMVPLLVTNSLGYSYVAAAGWCFIRGSRFDSSLQYAQLDFEDIVKILAGGKAFEIGTYAWVLLMYGAIHCNIRKKKKDQTPTSINGGVSVLLRQIQKKLYFIPAAFIILRMWGTIQFIVSIFVFNFRKVNQDGCIEKGYRDLYFSLAILQCIGDGAQGWVNCILYIFWSPKIRQRLILNPLSNCCYHVATQILPTTSRHSSALSPVNSPSPKSVFVSVQHVGEEDGGPKENRGGVEGEQEGTSALLQTFSREEDEERVPLIASEKT
uniref:G-protein coupled receptors family 2 profile 2 domain-containing protein n=1 Tax=Amphimedon queenslandica TaxID=400682 RepID=A0A1X7VGT0_AMPQE